MKRSEQIKYLIIALGIGAILFAVNIRQRSQGEVLGTFAATSTPSQVKLFFFDVGQGDSSLIIAPSGDDILVDGGPDNKVVQKLGQYLPYSDRRIEHVVLTHPHADHVDGLVEVLERYEVGEVIMTGVSHASADYREFLRLVREKGIPVLIIDKPQELMIGGLSLGFLEPDKPYADAKPDNLNNSSIVFQLKFVSTTALFMGDFENEEELLLQSRIRLASDVLKVGHHGSQNANDEGFINFASPKFAIISVGKDNRFGHPNYRTVHYLREIGSEIFRTDEAGDVILISDGRRYEALR